MFNSYFPPPALFRTLFIIIQETIIAVNVYLDPYYSSFSFHQLFQDILSTAFKNIIKP